MNHKIYPCDESKEWKDDFKSIQTPFDIENILRADAKLLAQWKRRPFYLDIDEYGDVVVRYVNIPQEDNQEWYQQVAQKAFWVEDENA